MAIKFPKPAAKGSIRFSLGRYNTSDEVDRAIATLPEIIENLSKNKAVSAV
jgi:cysteine sulfinate desulfinase/cysteine desulfurase-like protein